MYSEILSAGQWCLLFCLILSHHTLQSQTAFVHHKIKKQRYSKFKKFYSFQANGAGRGASGHSRTPRGGSTSQCSWAARVSTQVNIASPVRSIFEFEIRIAKRTRAVLFFFVGLMIRLFNFGTGRI